jgi:hypothetical protein
VSDFRKRERKGIKYRIWHENQDVLLLHGNFAKPMTRRINLRSPLLRWVDIQFSHAKTLVLKVEGG